MRNCYYHPVYRNCLHCGHEMQREEVRLCPMPESRPPHGVSDRVAALREARALLLMHAMSTWNGGLLERSDAITEVLAEFDLKFPEAKLP